eukprot:3392814-Amphidinium_carterae.1
MENKRLLAWNHVQAQAHATLRMRGFCMACLLARSAAHPIECARHEPPPPHSNLKFVCIGFDQNPDMTNVALFLSPRVADTKERLSFSWATCCARSSLRSRCL